MRVSLTTYHLPLITEINSQVVSKKSETLFHSLILNLCIFMHVQVHLELISFLNKAAKQIYLERR